MVKFKFNKLALLLVIYSVDLFSQFAKFKFDMLELLVVIAYAIFTLIRGFDKVISDESFEFQLCQ